jgi:dipeptidyl-peptidase-4
MKRFALLVPWLAWGVCLASEPSSPLTLATLVSKDLEPKTFGPAKWLGDGKAYTTVEDSKSIKDAKEIVAYDTRSGRRTVRVKAEALIPQGADKPLSIDDYEWSKDQKRLLIYTHAQKVWREKTRGDYWVLDCETGRLYPLGGAAEPSSLMFASFSPDGQRVAYLRRDVDPAQMPTNLYVEDWTTGKVTALTHDAEVRRSDGRGRTIINGTADWVNEEELDLRKAYEWSPDGRTIAYWQFDATAVRDFYLIDNTDTLYPALRPIPYPKAGTGNSSVRLGLVSSSGGPTHWLHLSDDEANHYIARIAWAPDSRELFVQQFDRPQQNLDVLAADVPTGAVRTVVHEHDDTWVDVVDDFKWLRKGREFLWISERDGWRHVYAVPREGGTPRLLTPGPFDVTGVGGVNERIGVLFFLASPTNATQRDLYRVPLNGQGNAVRVTPSNLTGTHTYDIAPNGRWAFHTESQIDTLPDTDLVSLTDHRVLRALLNNQALQSTVGPLFSTPTEFFHVRLPSGPTLDGWMLKPPHFDPARKYPVLVYVYGEPAGQTVLDRWGGRRMLFHRFLADRGYVVLSVDNRGTPAPKGHAWRHVIYGAIGVLAADEQAEALRALGAERPYLDLNRVAVWGWSGGGSMTLHLMFRHPELYKVGMSVAPMPDQRYYDTIYQERYMGTPQSNPDGYLRGSPIHYAEGLKGPLLIVSGTGDDNCHFQVTQLLLNRLIELGKPVDFMEYPNRSHSLDEGDGTLAHVYGTLARYLNSHVPAGGW